MKTDCNNINMYKRHPETTTKIAKQMTIDNKPTKKINNIMKNTQIKDKTNKKQIVRDFPGGPVVKNLCFHCRGQGFNLWSGN